MNEHGHMGDGVYLSDDGHQFWLAANDHRNKVIALEPSVMLALIDKICHTHPVMLTEIRKLIDD